MPPARSPGPRRPETLLHLSGEPVFLLGPAGRFLYVNPSWEELAGLAAPDVLGRGDETADPEPLESFRPPPEVFEGRPASALRQIRRPDGLRIWRRLEFWPHQDRDGRPLFVLGVVRPAEHGPMAPESDASRLRAELGRVQEELIGRLGTDGMIGKGPAHERLLGQVEMAALASAPALILGPPGSGKRQVAWTIHRRAGAPDAPLLAIDCAALPADWIDRELFGPPAEDGQGGSRLRFAGGTTLLLGDVLELPRDVQARLAEALPHAKGERIRVLAATSGDPDEAVRGHRLRGDLYYALSGLVIRLAPLQHRLEELPLLAQHFLERANRRDGRRVQGFRPEALEILRQYDWPGNLRELARVVDAAHQRAEGDTIDPEHLPGDIQGHRGAAYLPPPRPPEALPLDATLERLERRLIEQAMRSAKGNKSLASKTLHISRARLHRRIQELGLAGEPDGEGPEPPADRRPEPE